MLEVRQLEPFIYEVGHKHIVTLVNVLEQLGKTIHRIAWQLRPSSIDDCGLVRTLENYTNDWSKRFGIKVDFYCNDMKIDELPDQTRTAIYRVFQEALANVSKHADGASIVSIIIEQFNHMLHLTIEDNGCGFDSEKYLGQNELRIEHGLGLIGMRERIELLGGDLRIELSASAGTTIFARVPVIGHPVAT